MAEVTLPMICGDVTLIALGKLDPAALGSHDEDYVYPVGFRTSRKHASATNPSSKCLYHSEITTGPQGTPVFKVTCADMSEHPYEDSTPNGVWSLVFEAIASCSRRSSRGGGPAVSDKKGWELFGLNSDKIKKFLMEMDGVEKCKRLRYNKDKAAKETKQKKKQEEEEEREERDERERDKKRKDKTPKTKKKISDYQQPPMLEELKLGEWRCMEDDMEVMPCGSEDVVAVDKDIPEGEHRQREQLHKIWELAAAQQFLRSFKIVLGISPLTSEDFHTAFLECSSALKMIHLRLLMPAAERKRAPEMAEGDGWLDSLRVKLRTEPKVFDEEIGRYVKQAPIWSKFLDKDPMPESIHQYFELSLRTRAIILWWLCEDLLDCDEVMRDKTLGKMDWDASADSIRYDPNALDTEGNAYWYFEGSSGVLYKEEPPKPGRKAKPPLWQPICRGHEDLADVGSKLQQEGKKRKLKDLHAFGTWIVDTEAPKLHSKEQAKERAKSKAALMELLPRKRSSRVATKEERDKDEAEQKKYRDEELALRRTEEERKRKERERVIQDKVRQTELAKVQKEEQRKKEFFEAERERRLRKRRRLLAKQAQLTAAAEAKAEMHQGEENEGDWWEIGNHVEVFSDSDWWQAVVLKNRTAKNSQEMEIFVAYIGGSEDDNEWLSTTSVRVRPPSDSFWDQVGGEGDDDMALDAVIAKELATSGVSSERKKAGSSFGAAQQSQSTHPMLSNPSSNTNSGIDSKSSLGNMGGNMGVLLAAAVSQVETQPILFPTPQPLSSVPHMHMQAILEPLPSLHHLHHHHDERQHQHQVIPPHFQHQQQVFTQMHPQQMHPQQMHMSHTAAAPSQQGIFGSMHVPSMIAAQPHMNSASSMHGEAPLGMLPAPTASNSNRPSSSDLIGLLNSASNAMPMMLDSAARHDGFMCAASATSGSDRQYDGMGSHGFDAMSTGPSFGNAMSNGASFGNAISNGAGFGDAMTNGASLGNGNVNGNGET